MGITSIKFSGFKALSDYSVSLRSFNVLVGPNNAGKSTVLDGLRLIWGAHRFAKQRKPVHFASESNGMPSGWGWQIPNASFPFDLENIHTNYRDEPASVSLRLENGNRLTLWFPASGRAHLFMDSDSTLPKTTAAFQSRFDLRLAIIPMLGPLEREEDLVDEDYLDRVAWSHRASRLFRNLWHRDRTGFPSFRQLVESTWPGVTIDLPEKADMLSKRLVMFCRENGIAREVAWAGSGFQIWLQLLTHVVRASKCNILVVDEPEIYLHPDLQRQIVHVLKQHAAQILLATHSVEVINEVDPADLLLVERQRASARRLTDVAELEQATQLLGSSQNMHLSRLARARRVLFVEGNDKQILGRLAAKLGIDVLSSGRIAVMPIGGFSQYGKIANAQWAFMKVLGESIKVAVLLDRDYRCEEELASIAKDIATQTSLSCILPCKEIENCVLIPRAIQAAVDAKLIARAERGGSSKPVDIDVRSILIECAEELKEDVRAQLSSAALRYHRASGRDPSTILKEQSRRFEESWKALDGRLAMVPGKELLASVNTVLQKKYNISVSIPQIIACMKRDEVPTRLADFLQEVSLLSLSTDKPQPQ